VREQVGFLLPQGPSAEPGGIVFFDGLMLQRLAADLALESGDLSEAKSWLDANDRWLAWSGAVLGRSENRLCWSRYWRKAGDATRAMNEAEAAVEAASEPRQPLALLAAHRARAELAIDLNRLDEAERDLDLSRRLAEACAAPYELALTLLTLAEAKRAGGQDEETRLLLDKARGILTPLRAEPALARHDALAASLAAPQSRPAPLGDLTPREVEVLRLVAEGLTDAEVAGRLYISPRTVSQHLRSVYGKLDVSSRAAATRFAVENRLV
jgi:DNA-binding CsgD family transcriptional regulator